MREQTAQATEKLFHNRLEEHYDALARHYSRSENTEKAKVSRITGLLGPKMIAEGDTVVIQWVGNALSKSGKRYNNSYCYVVQIEDGKIIRGTAYLDTELVRSIW